MYSRKLHIPVVLVRIGTSSNSVETFQHLKTPDYGLGGRFGGLRPNDQ